MQHTADIGVFGGSGFYKFLEDVEEVWIETPYGPTSSRIALAEVAGRRVAFLPRHGEDHRYPPSLIPYRANLWAMKQLGVKRVIGPCAAGSLQSAVAPGSFVLCDQFVDRTWGRADTFYEGPIVTHLSAAEPYCPQLRELAFKVGRDLGIHVHPRGTMVVIQGPRFSTRAESRWFQTQGWEVINMTGYPECILARELEMCYVNVSLITDYDTGVPGHETPVSHEEVLRTFAANNQNVKKLILGLIEKIPLDAPCSCHTALASAR